MTKYVVGFMFSEDLSQVVLILKNRPKWQAGMLNGVGGKVEHNESYLQAMRREFKEETNLYVENWINFATIEGIDYQLECFTAVGDVSNIETMTDEPVIVVNVDSLYSMTVIFNLRWLIPLALDKGIYHCKIQAS